MVSPVIVCVGRDRSHIKRPEKSSLLGFLLLLCCYAVVQVVVVLVVLQERLDRRLEESILRCTFPSWVHIIYTRKSESCIHTLFMYVAYVTSIRWRRRKEREPCTYHTVFVVDRPLILGYLFIGYRTQSRTTETRTGPQVPMILPILRARSLSSDEKIDKSKTTMYCTIAL